MVSVARGHCAGPWSALCEVSREAELVGTIPLPYAGVVADLIVVHTLDVPRDRFVYDESYRAVVADALFMVLRIAAVARFLPEESLRTGVLMEQVFDTGRPHGVGKDTGSRDRR